jgi:hypothetical protein
MKRELPEKTTGIPTHGTRWMTGMNGKEANNKKRNQGAMLYYKSFPERKHPG